MVSREAFLIYGPKAEIPTGDGKRCMPLCAAWEGGRGQAALDQFKLVAGTFLDGVRYFSAARVEVFCESQFFCHNVNRRRRFS